ncbi:MAG TPA: hypothetical protein VFJ23_02400 [Candidatus Nitrosotalea sp.]|nr:hypothetical protein [Candidatus Nitrosotalea sp.]
MKISSYCIMALVILAMSAPALVLAETENEANEGTNELTEKQSTTTETEHEGSDKHSMSSTNSGLILLVTIAAIASVVGYSSWKVYKIRRRAASKKLV